MQTLLLETRSCALVDDMEEGLYTQTVQTGPCSLADGKIRGLMYTQMIETEPCAQRR